jgi:hypothetical protein
MLGRRNAILFAIVVVMAVDFALSAATLTVTDTIDAGAGSLRQAILDANSTAGIDSIEFAIPEGSCAANGVCTISLASSLPDVTEGIVIDGTTQPRYGTAPENVCATRESPSFMRILISATDDYVFNITASSESMIRGLAIAGSGSTHGIRLHTNAGIKVQCNHFGTDGPGMSLLDLSDALCISCYDSGGNAIIGTDGDGVDDLGERNVFGGRSVGVNINFGNATYPNRISGNYFGVGSDGTTPMGLSLGVFMRQGATQNLIGSDLNGTSDELERNIFAHTRSGVWDDSRMIDGGENKIVGNWFGMDAFARPGRISGAAIRFSDSGQNHEIRRNQVSWNGEGILVSGTATFAASSGQNCILGNDVGLLHEGDVADLFAEDNYWGAANGPSGVGSGSGDAIAEAGTGTVDFSPWLTSPTEACDLILADGFESGDLAAWSGTVP